MPAGLAPKDAVEVNSNVGYVLRQFVDVKESVGHLRDSLAGVDLSKDPYNMTTEDQVLIKSAINDLDQVLDGLDMTFINQLVGLW